MLVFNQKFVSGRRKIKSTIEGLAFDRPCWAIIPDLLHTLTFVYSVIHSVVAHSSENFQSIFFQNNTKLYLLEMLFTDNI